jgi:hypothetical protein
MIVHRQLYAVVFSTSLHKAHVSARCEAISGKVEGHTTGDKKVDANPLISPNASYVLFSSSANKKAAGKPVFFANFLPVSCVPIDTSSTWWPCRVSLGTVTRAMCLASSLNISAEL